MKKSLFRLNDALSFGLPALLMTAISTWMVVAGFESDASPAQVLGLMYTISAVICFIYGVLLYSRWQFLKRIDFVTKHGWNVVTNDLAVTKEEIEEEVDRTIELWKEKANWSNEIMNKAINEINSDWVLFCEPDKIEHERLGALAGYVTGKNVVVGFVGARDIRRTALAHEAGHILHKAYLGHWDNEGCHEFMRKKGLP